MKILREKLGDSLAAIRSNFSNPQLRRLQLAGAGSITGQWASIALAVFAFNDGGAKAVGIVALIRTIPSAIAAPFTSTLADRFPRVAVMASASLGRAVTIGSAGAVALSGGPSWLVYVLAGTTSILATRSCRPSRLCCRSSRGRRRSCPPPTSPAARSTASAASSGRRSAAACSRSRAPVPSFSSRRARSSGARCWCRRSGQRRPPAEGREASAERELPSGKPVRASRRSRSSAGYGS